MNATTTGVRFEAPTGFRKPEAEPPVGVKAPRNAVIGIVPPFGSTPGAYCNVEDGDLLLEFHNSGGLPSGPIDVRVKFIDPTSSITRTLATIDPNESDILRFQIPDGWLHYDFEHRAHFVITWSNQPAVLGECIVIL